MPLRLVDLIRRYVVRYVLVPAVAVTVLGAASAMGLAFWLEERAETKLLDANAKVFEQLILSGDSVGLGRQLSAVASSRQWTSAFILDASSRIIAAYPTQDQVGAMADSRAKTGRRTLHFGLEGTIGRLRWDSNPWKATIPTMVAVLGILAVLIWSQASLGIFLGRTISIHTRSLEELSKLFVRSKPLAPEDLAAMPAETLEATQLLQAIRQFIVFEKQVKTAELEAEKQRALSAIASQVAHDIRSPLAALDSVLGDVAQLPPDKRSMVQHAAGRIRDIADNLLATHREAKSATALEAQGISELILPLIAEKKLQFRSRTAIRIDARLDNASRGLRAKVEPVSFKRALSNIINNAVEALGDAPGNVTATLSARDGQVLITIEDDGKGIPPEILSRLGRRGETHGKDGGSGLGLHHAKTMVESWGGRFEIDSEPGKGTRVVLRLPAVSPESSAVLIDDDKLVHMVWRLAAKANGKTLRIFTSAKEFSDSTQGLDKAAPIYVDSDLGEGVRGEEFAEQLHARGFVNLYLATGRSPDSFPPMPWLKGIVGKESPWG